MLYLAIIPTPQMLAVPRSDGHVERPGLMTLILTRGGAETRFTGLLDTETDTLYYLFEVPETTGLTVGEYDYSLLNVEGEQISCGILTAGDYKRPQQAPVEPRKIVEYGG